MSTKATVTGEEIGSVGQDARTAELVVECDCGFEAGGTEEELILIIQEHGLEAHNVNVADEQVLASVRPTESSRPEGWTILRG